MALLESVADDLWTVARSLRFLGVETGARMTIVRLPAGQLLVHSPAPLRADLQQEVDAIGRVAFVIAPSRFHHLAVAEWKSTYAAAVFACCPGLDRKRPDVAWVLGNREPGATWIERWLVRDRAVARAQIDRMLAWDPQRILLSHGPCIDVDGARVLRRAYAWL